MSRVFVTRALPGDGLERLRAEHEVEVWEGDGPPSPEELQDKAADALALLTMLTDRIDQATFDAAPDLRAIANYAVGSDNIDLAGAAERGVAVGVTPDVLTDATADLTWALLLGAARRLPEGIDAVREGRWTTWEPQGWLGASVGGTTLGLVGYGRIGQAVAQRATGFGMQVLVAKRDDEEGLERVLSESDFVSLHCPLTDATRHLIDEAALKRMKPTAILVNTARGPVVDTDALTRALHEGAIGGAALDVTDPEPLPADHPLLAAPNLLVLPHVGSGTHAAREQMVHMAVDNLLAGLAGEPMPHPSG